jgi:hypothetical protein
MVPLILGHQVLVRGWCHVVGAVVFEQEYGKVKKLVWTLSDGV